MEAVGYTWEDAEGMLELRAGGCQNGVGSLGALGWDLWAQHVSAPAPAGAVGERLGPGPMSPSASNWPLGQLRSMGSIIS